MIASLAVLFFILARLLPRVALCGLLLKRAVSKHIALKNASTPYVSTEKPFLHTDCRRLVLLCIRHPACLQEPERHPSRTLACGFRYMQIGQVMQSTPLHRGAYPPAINEHLWKIWRDQRKMISSSDLLFIGRQYTFWENLSSGKKTYRDRPVHVLQ